jgi:16S rRNA processing protein RimM
MGRPVTVGHVVRAHGVRGDVVIHRYGETAGVLARGAEVELKKGGLQLVLTIHEARPYQQDWLVSFEGMTDRNEAQALAGGTLYVDSEILPPLEEGIYYDFQLVGLQVVTVDGEGLGRVEDILETGAHDVIVVRGPRGEVLLPSVEQVVREVDLEEGRMFVDPPPGLIPEDDEGKDRTTEAS